MSVPQVLGPYQLKAKLAVGGHSEVWLGVRRGPGGFQRRCALKLLVPPMSYDETARKAFIAEARLMALFDHPNLIPVTDLGEDPDASVVYAVMPYVSGTSLAAIARDKRFDGLELVEGIWLISRVLLALDFAHKLKDRGRDLNIIHRDVSPENVLVGYDGQIRLIDFGIALSTINPRNTRIHVVKGKLDFLSPEQAMASPRIDHTTDIYNAGLLLYTLLTGANPLDGKAEEALQRARNPVIPRVDTVISCPDELMRLIHAMLSPIPSERPQDAGKIARSLLSMLHRLEPFYDETIFCEQVRRRLSGKIEEEHRFLNGLGEGTQIIRTGELDAVNRDQVTRRDETTPIIAAEDILTAARAPKRAAGADQTRDDLQAILAELEEIYDD